MVERKTAVTPLLTQWSSCSLRLSIDMILSGTKAPRPAATDKPPSHPTGPGVAGEEWEVDNKRSDLGESKVISQVKVTSSDIDTEDAKAFLVMSDVTSPTGSLPSVGPIPPAGSASEGEKTQKPKKRRKRKKSKSAQQQTTSETFSSVEQGN